MGSISRPGRSARTSWPSAFRKRTAPVTVETSAVVSAVFTWTVSPDWLTSNGVGAGPVTTMIDGGRSKLASGTAVTRMVSGP